MSHEAFVALSYGISAVTILAMIVWVVMDGRARRKELSDLEAHGASRRGIK